MSLCGTLAVLACVFLGLGSLGPRWPHPTRGAPVRVTPERGRGYRPADLLGRLAPADCGRMATYSGEPGDSGEPPRIEWSCRLDSGWRDCLAVSRKDPGGTGDDLRILGEVFCDPGDRTAFAASGRPRHPARSGKLARLRKDVHPEAAPIALMLPLADGAPPADPRGAPLIAAARRNVPTPSPWPRRSSPPRGRHAHVKASG